MKHHHQTTQTTKSGTSTDSKKQQQEGQAEDLDLDEIKVEAIKNVDDTKDTVN